LVKVVALFLRSLSARRQYLFTSSGKSNNAPKLKSPTEMPKWTAKLKTKTPKANKVSVEKFLLHPLSLSLSLSLSPLCAEAQGWEMSGSLAVSLSNLHTKYYMYIHSSHFYDKSGNKSRRERAAVSRSGKWFRIIGNSRAQFYC
jgi:hypothetical protein